jgi:hypothetical protein
MTFWMACSRGAAQRPSYARASRRSGLRRASPGPEIHSEKRGQSPAKPKYYNHRRWGLHHRLKHAQPKTSMQLDFKLGLQLE